MSFPNVSAVEQELISYSFCKVFLKTLITTYLKVFIVIFLFMKVFDLIYIYLCSIYYNISYQMNLKHSTIM